MQNFLEASTWRPISSGTYAWDVDPHWFQGRGVFGGLQAAAVVRAMGREVTPERTLRALHLQFCAPLQAGEARLYVKRERKGAALSFLSARVVQKDRTILYGTASLGRPRKSVLDHKRQTLPKMPPAERVPPIEMEGTDMPEFARHFLEYRFCHGSLPLSGAKDASLGGYVRFLDSGPLDAPMAVALLDALPPAALVPATAVRPMGTIAYAVHCMGSLPPTGCSEDTAWPICVTSDRTTDGYSDETNMLWSPDGELLACARQLVAVV